MADNDSLEFVTLRNNFYRDNYRRLVGALLVIIIINICLIGAIIYLITHRPTPQYFATSSDGRITPLYPLSQPSLSDAELLQWSNEAATKAYTYNFVNYRQALQDASQYFTPQGWEQFQNELKNSRNLETVLAKKFVVSAVPTGAPSVTERGSLNGRYAWKVQIPLLVTYENVNDRIQQPVTVNMLVIRVSNLNTPRGVGINQFIASERPIAR